MTIKSDTDCTENKKSGEESPTVPDTNDDVSTIRFVNTSALALNEDCLVPQMTVSKSEEKAFNIESKDSADHNFKKNDVDEECSTNIPEKLQSPIVDVHLRVPIYVCHPCGIRFSSLSTLEAHQTYYCSHRKDAEEDPITNNTATTEAACTGEPSAKCLKTGKQYACMHCSYSADKKVSLNRHMRIHQLSPAPSLNVVNGDDTSSQQVDRYCSECDIRFSSIKTYRAHKQHYCSSRRTDGQIETPKSDTRKSGSTSPQERSKTPGSTPLSQPFLALPTNPIIIVPYSLVRAASVLPGPLNLLAAGIENPDTTCFSFENGTLQPLATMMPTEPVNKSASPGIFPASSLLLAATIEATNIEKTKSNENGEKRRETVPLDLSLRKISNSKQRQQSETFSLVTENKLGYKIECTENLTSSGSKITAEQIVCAPSLPNSPPLSPSPKRRPNSPKDSCTSVSPNVVASNSIKVKPTLELTQPVPENSLVIPSISKQILELSIRSEPSVSSIAEQSPLSQSTTSTTSTLSTLSSVQPQIYVKQGVSKCKECNIVFCKFENFLAHKQHYCSARNYEDSEKKVSPTPLAASQSDSGSHTISYQQLICAACGIKYTSLDNLRAHQTFYCPKEADFSLQTSGSIEKCLKCQTVHESGQHCPTKRSFKCPVCDETSINASERKTHLETHGSIKSFACSICSYKGNTLRGMRTHIRMHFDKNCMDFNEEDYMSCILDDDSADFHNIPSENYEQYPREALLTCEICNYSSSYKGNMLRHMKSVHSRPSQSSQDSENKETDTEETIINGDAKTEPNNRNSLTVKAEPQDIIINECEKSLSRITMEIKAETEGKSEQDIITNAFLCTSPASSEENSRKSIGPKYCQICDIKFNYMNTYLAHKQFYCKNNERESSSSYQTQTRCQKNKENIETLVSSDSQNNF